MDHCNTIRSLQKTFNCNEKSRIKLTTIKPRKGRFERRWKMFYRITDEGNAEIFNNDGQAVTRIDANVYPVGSILSAMHEHPEGVILTVEDAESLNIEPEYPIND